MKLKLKNIKGGGSIFGKPYVNNGSFIPLTTKQSQAPSILSGLQSHSQPPPA
jgi:hypothetical protein